MTKITYFVHGTTTDNEQGLETGWNPGVLSKLGLQQAKELPEQISDSSFTVMYSSDLRRAIDSARLGFADTHELRQDKRLREVNNGDDTGKPGKDVKPDPTIFINTAFPNGESYKDVEKRMKSFLGDIKSEFPNGHIAIMAHLGPQLALEVLTNNLSWEEAFASDWRNTKSWQPGWTYEI